MRRDGAAATGSIANQVDDAPRSRDPLDAYFRNLNNAELLSRGEELALAKRIDEAQRALLICLCRIPLIVERVGAWGDELRDGRLRLSYLLDAVPSDELEATEDDLLGDDGSLDVSAEAVDLIPRLELVAALSAEIAGLARKRIAALARGKELSRRERRRLDELLSRAAGGYCGPASAAGPNFGSCGRGRHRGPEFMPDGARAVAAGRRLRHRTRGGDRPPLWARARSGLDRRGHISIRPRLVRSYANACAASGRASCRLRGCSPAAGLAAV